MDLKNVNQIQSDMKTGAVKGHDVILFDDMLEKLGKFGRYQKLLYFFVVLPSVCSVFPMMSLVFILGEHNHRCAAELNDTYSQSEETVYRNDSLGHSLVELYSECKVTITNTTTNETTYRGCDSWVYDKSVYQSTVISEYNLVCDDVILQPHATMMYFGGVLVGSIVLMPLADM